MRVYIKDKPHKWGTKLFMLCCSQTAYCIGFEVYCGKKERAGQASSTDYRSGPAAVVRNLQQVFGPTAPPSGDMRLVVMDRFYSSVSLSMQLLTMDFYSIGTVRTDRQGLSTKLIPKTEGVDVHDQLRLQRYSLQLCIKYKKYYKGLLLGLVDLAIINAYIVFKAARAASSLSKRSHVKFLKQLQIELSTPSKAPNPIVGRRATHNPLPNDEWRPGNNNQNSKRRIRACKVCSLLKDSSKSRSVDSSTYGSTCKLQNASKKSLVWRVFLFEKKHNTFKGELRSCFDIWHKC
ncbi:hypothetical protein PHMEG_00035249 [Phytophthora megakarya]|uniref:PiggyBac transposable element-derived protein domain-containing protein n=1 Tax=Phytophthora megakarya TaxID=4795 RepID=A0A225UPE3_9STRA|nr:hypothetical protein PHMEG_00035249 [Phytophthora megakarya]